MNCPDPLLAAGYLDCARCGAAGFPTDAVWLAPDLLVAIYEGPCPHVSIARLVDTAQQGPPTRCLGTTLAGRRCNRSAGPDGYCQTHDPARVQRHPLDERGGPQPHG